VEKLDEYGLPIGEFKTPLVPLYNEEGTEIETKVAEFDLFVSIGAGLPHNKSFLYQAVVELQREGLITTEEGRMFLKQMLSFPIIDPLNPIGTFAGRNMPPHMMQAMNQGFNNYGNIPVNDSQMSTQPEDIPPEFLQTLTERLGGGSIAT
jgi:hypothetical protein